MYIYVHIYTHIWLHFNPILFILSSKYFLWLHSILFISFLVLSIFSIIKENKFEIILQQLHFFGIVLSWMFGCLRNLGVLHRLLPFLVLLNFQYVCALQRQSNLIKTLIPTIIALNQPRINESQTHYPFTFPKSVIFVPKPIPYCYLLQF